MEHADHVALLRIGVPERGPDAPFTRWADLGSGTGAFTFALADLLGANAEIVSLDRDRRALQNQRQAMTAHFPETPVAYVVADLAQPLDLPLLDGIVMANSLHFLRNKQPTLGYVYAALRPGGRLILVEYDIDRGNRWVPYPLSYQEWERVAIDAGFVDTRLLMRRPSRFLDAIYSACSFTPDSTNAHVLQPL